MGTRFELSDYERDLISDALNEYDRLYCSGKIEPDNPDRFKTVLNMLIGRFETPDRSSLD